MQQHLSFPFQTMLHWNEVSHNASLKKRNSRIFKNGRKLENRSKSLHFTAFFKVWIMYFILYSKYIFFFVKILKPVEHHRRIACCPHYIDGWCFQIFQINFSLSILKKKLHQNSEFTTRISIWKFVKNHPSELQDWKTRFRKTYRSL